jgi:hypothetical protein
MSKEVKTLILRLSAIILFLSVVLTVLILFNNKKQNNLPIELPYKNIFVSDKEKELSDFDNWLCDEVGVDWTPSYIILQGHDVLGIIKGTDFNTFKKELNKLNKLDVSISNDLLYNPFFDTTHKFSDILKNDELNIIELHMIGCKDCEELDNNGITNDIRRNVNASFYRYYIRSTVADVLDKYMIKNG